MMKCVVVALAASALLLGGCNSDGPKKVTPTAEPEATATAGATSVPTPPPPGATPDVTKCPVDATTCAVAERFISAWKAKDVDALMAMAKPLPTSCPVPPWTGLGGPYPLCDGATIDGEVREGFVWSSGTHGGLESREALRQRLAGASAVEEERALLTIGCAVGEGTNACEGNFVLTFGAFPSGSDAQGVRQIPVIRPEEGQAGLIGVLPIIVDPCKHNPEEPACARVSGGKWIDPGYWYWGNESETPRPLPEWTYFRWTP